MMKASDLHEARKICDRLDAIRGREAMLGKKEERPAGAWLRFRNNSQTSDELSPRIFAMVLREYRADLEAERAQLSRRAAQIGLQL
jgi:hypothetical protein